MTTFPFEQKFDQDKEASLDPGGQLFINKILIGRARPEDSKMGFNVQIGPQRPKQETSQVSLTISESLYSNIG